MTLTKNNTFISKTSRLRTTRVDVAPGSGKTTSNKNEKPLVFTLVLVTLRNAVHNVA